MAYWKLDEGSGTSIADSSGTGNVGTLTGSPTWAGAIDHAPTAFANTNALILNGTSQFAKVLRTPALEPTSFTVSLWAKQTPGATQLAFAKIFQKQFTTAAPYDSIALNVNHAGDPSVVTLDLSLDTAGVATARNISSPAGVMPAGAWTHIVAVYDPAGSAPQERLYVNGVLSASASHTEPVIYDRTATGHVYLGQNGRNQQFFAGSIDDVRFYNRALTPAEIQSLFAGQ